MGQITFPYIDEWGDEFEIAFVLGSYQDNGRLAIEAWWRGEDDDDYWEMYSPVTVNLWEPIDGVDCAYLDVNNSSSLVRWMIDQGFVGLVPRVARSGFCSYPEGRFTAPFLNSCLTDPQELEELGQERRFQRHSR